ncbi:MAG: hypothetical protein PF636_05500 [Actinomycetota bacterium]|nr:hypothetical protein [Actinomycetota bacterium]
MKRSRRIALVSHCLLNVNAKVEGLAEYQGVHPVIEGLSAAGFGVIQLPCLEMTHMGMKRWAQVMEQYDHPAYCGVSKVCSGDWGGVFDDEARVRILSKCERADVPGVFMRCLRDRLEPMGIRFDAVDQRETDDGTSRILAGN